MEESASILSVFNGIPAQLSRHEKRFVLADVRSGARMRDFDSAFEWLKSAMTVNVCYHASEPNVGLDLNSDPMSCIRRTSRSMPASSIFPST